MTLCTLRSVCIGSSSRRRCENPPVRIPAKVDYGIRAMAEIAAAEPGVPVKGETMAAAQGLPLKFLLGILTDLRRGRLLKSQRGPDGGFLLARPAEEIALADIFRVLDGPLAEIRDQSLSTLEHSGASADLPKVWMAVRASLRRVLETVTIADLASSDLPPLVAELADEYRVDTDQRTRDRKR
jgi:Rrf2 family protein